MSRGIEILDGISEWIRGSVGPEAENRGQDATPDGDDEGAATVADDSDRANSDYDAPACCSAAGNTDISVLDS